MLFSGQSVEGQEEKQKRRRGLSNNMGTEKKPVYCQSKAGKCRQLRVVRDGVDHGIDRNW